MFGNSSEKLHCGNVVTCPIDSSPILLLFYVVQRQHGELTLQQHFSEQAGSLSMTEGETDGDDDDDQDAMVSLYLVHYTEFKHLGSS